jgi:hypothetical protein
MPIIVGWTDGENNLVRCTHPQQLRNIQSTTWVPYNSDFISGRPSQMPAFRELGNNLE